MAHNFVLSLKVCKGSGTYSQCDASFSIMGFMGQVKQANQAVGEFYNYHCASQGWTSHESDVGLDITTFGSYLGYCCCRKP